jgi:hypothetical protein
LRTVARSSAETSSGAAVWAAFCESVAFEHAASASTTANRRATAGRNGIVVMSLVS